MTDKFVGVTYMLMDAMAPVIILSQLFQKENVDIAIVRVKIDHCLEQLIAVSRMESPHLKQLAEDLSNGKLKDHNFVAKIPLFSLEKVTDDFIKNLTDNINSRFPEDDLLSNFKVPATRPLRFLTKEAQREFHIAEIEKLAEQYGAERSVTWLEDGKENSTSAQPLRSKQDVLPEWRLLKEVEVADQFFYRRNPATVGSYYRVQGRGFPQLNPVGRACINIGSAHSRV